MDSNGAWVDAGTDVRAQAIGALGELGPEAGNGTVAGALHDPVDVVRSAAVRVLYRRREGRTLAGALSWLPSEQGRSRALAIHAVTRLRSTEVARVAARALIHRHGDAALPEADVELLLELSESDHRSRPLRGVVRELLAALTDESSIVVSRVEDLLVRMAPRSTQQVIEELLRGAAPARAAAVLGRIGDVRALDTLVLALDHPEPAVRMEAATSLGMLRDPTAVEPLLRATRDSALEVRSAASHALDSMGSAAVIVGVATLLRPALTDSSSAPTEALVTERLAKVLDAVRTDAEPE